MLAGKPPPLLKPESEQKMANCIVKSKKDAKGKERKLFIYGSGEPTIRRASKEGLFLDAAEKLVVRAKNIVANKMVGYKTIEGDRPAARPGFIQFYVAADFKENGATILELANTAVAIEAQNVLRSDLESELGTTDATPTAKVSGKADA